MSKPTHIEFLESPQFLIHPEENKDGSQHLHIKCQLSVRQSEIIKSDLQDYNVIFTNQDAIIFPSAKQTAVYKNVEIINGVAFLDQSNIELM